MMRGRRRRPPFEPSRPGVFVIDSAGKEVAFIQTGEPRRVACEPSGNLSFGNCDDKIVLSITVDNGFYRNRLDATCCHIPWAGWGASRGRSRNGTRHDRRR
jgi:hypothetical protein